MSMTRFMVASGKILMTASKTFFLLWLFLPFTHLGPARGITIRIRISFSRSDLPGGWGEKRCINEIVSIVREPALSDRRQMPLGILRSIICCSLAMLYWSVPLCEIGHLPFFFLPLFLFSCPACFSLLCFSLCFS